MLATAINDYEQRRENLGKERIMTQHYYIENGFEFNVIGAVGFLVQRSEPYKPYINPTHKLYDRPACTNMSHQPKLNGWCGSTDNVSINALGVAQVVQVFANGRARVRTLHGAEAVEALGKLGWSDMDEQMQAKGE